MSNSTYGSRAKGIIEGLEDSPGEKSKKVNDQKNRPVKEQTMKRSFLLTPKQVERVYLLKAKNSDKTLSTIVGEAIDAYYERQSAGE